jgi:uncharacterized membrane protein SpoIIM required for sporulation
VSIASALTEKAFAERRRADWEELDALTRAAAAKGLRRLETESVVRLSPLYRSVCADLAAAQAARYSAPLVDYLRGLTAAAHGVMYGPHAAGREDRERARIRHAWLVAFPRAVRRRKREMLLAAALFFAPLALGVALTWRDPTFAFRIVPEAMLRPLTEAYAKGFEGGREAGEGAMMAGFYVYNNVGIALRCFALGLFGGIGSAFYLVQNGLSIGAILGYVASQGAGANVVLFIVGHGTLELGAIVLAGGSGLSLGWSVVAPGDLPRLVSLQRRAREVLVIVGGASVMLLMAATIEAFWSASSVAREVKLAVGAALFGLVLAYILVAGRSGDERQVRR